MHTKEIELLQALFPCLLQFLEKTEGSKKTAEHFARFVFLILNSLSIIFHSLLYNNKYLVNIEKPIYVPLCPYHHRKINCYICLECGQ